MSSTPSRPELPADPSALVTDAVRLAAVRATGLLDTSPEEAFDRMTRLAAKMIGAPATFISLVDADRDFYKSSVGFPEPLATDRQLAGRTFCHYSLLSERPLVLEDVAALPGFRDVPTVHSLGVRAYLGVPLRTPAGQAVGSFCAIDVQPRVWSEQDVETLTELAASVMREINLREAVRDAERRVVDAALKQEDAERHERRATFAADISSHLIQADDLPTVLQHCAAAMVQHLDAALARIWTVNDSSRTLELQASAGLYTHLDGPHGRVPLGQLKIGVIAEEQRPHLTNALIDDPRLGDRAWAIREGLTAFAGYPLIVDDRAVGVMAMFARHSLSPATLDAMGAAANAIAIGVRRKRAEDALKAADRRKDVFVATMAHELRQPLAAIVPALGLLRVRISEQSSERAREVIERQVALIQLLVDDLMDVAGISEGKIALRLARVNLCEVLENVAHGVRTSIDQRGLTLELGLPQTPVWVLGDSGRLQQVFSNLLTNAVKYTPSGGRIEVRVAHLPSSARVSVRDSGKGIAPHALPYIFDLFMQEDGEQRAGLGIGLKVVRGLVDLHGGTVEARSDGVGRGTEFVVALPLPTPPADEPATP